ncbi:MAG: glycosyltransferase family 2 protein [Candidatus Falkowbacteria bacterium]|nr:glycosyltransferase family 2 protein [Candidatus Falkowbacteria bacterium]
MKLSIIIVSYNVNHKLRANLQAIFSSVNAPEFEVFVIDNNSSDGSAVMVGSEFPQVTLIANTDNLGFAKANNQAIKLAKGEFILLLNPDMLVTPETLAEAVSAAQERPEAVVSSIKLVDEKGEIIPHIRRFPQLFDQLMVILKIPHLFPGVLNSYLDKKFDYQKEAAVDSVRGAFFLINCKAWQKISGEKKPFLDERYFIWFEEVDFCRQVREKGGEIWYFPSASCLDYVGASFSQVNRSIKQQYFRDSMLKYFAKWHSNFALTILSASWRLVNLFIKK